jgi:hypothetical protein
VTLQKNVDVMKSVDVEKKTDDAKKRTANDAKKTKESVRKKLLQLQHLKLSQKLNQLNPRQIRVLTLML